MESGLEMQDICDQFSGLCSVIKCLLHSLHSLKKSVFVLKALTCLFLSGKPQNFEVEIWNK